MQSRLLWQISIQTSAAAEAVLIAGLEQATGAPAASYTDARTGRTTVSVYLPGPPGALLGDRLAKLRAQLRLRMGGRAVPVTVRALRPVEWVEAWKQHFRPLVFGRVLLIRPGWSRRRARSGQRVLVLNPGLSFGTGQHPTTRYCLREAIRRIRRPRRATGLAVLDLGTGSGILALAAAKLGCAPVLALDNDPVAVRIARANARANGLAGRVRIVRADLRQRAGLPRRRFDLVFANLQADLLLATAGAITDRVKPGGHLLVAGVLAREFAAVRRRFVQGGLQLIASQRTAEWRSGTLFRPLARGKFPERFAL